MKIIHVVGARPNFPKLAPVYRAARDAGIGQRIVHTGQHYDDGLSTTFFRQLGIPSPDVDLGVGSASHAVQTARVMERLEPVLCADEYRWLVVYGDVNSTMAAAIVASKLGIPVAHVEAGLRSGDWSMPEEINRIVTDRLADLLLTPSRDASETLKREGETDASIVFVGNVMIDSLLHALESAKVSGVAARLGVDDASVLVTLHRPSNVDDRDRFGALAGALRAIAESRRVFFPLHPRTRSRVEQFAVDLGGVCLLEPLDYLGMLDVMSRVAVVITDSGGIQEETTALGIPCLTVRDSTERPITVTDGTNRLVPDVSQLPSLVASAKRSASFRRPEGWDGSAGPRVVQALLRP